MTAAAADAGPALRIGVLGAARIAPDVVVYPSLARGDVELTAVAARDPGRARAFAERHGFRRALDDYAAVIAAPEIDLVYNPLPIDLHAEWTIRALDAGKHVLCEKPFAMNLDEAQAVLAAARRTGRRVIEALHYRYHPAFATFLGWLRAGLIGRVLHVEASLNVAIPDAGGTEIRHRPENGGGAFMDLGCYPLSWALTAIGQAPLGVEAEAVLTGRGVDEEMTAMLHFPGGLTARLHASMAMSAKTHVALLVTGEEGCISFENPSIPQRGYRLTLRRDGRIEEASIDRTTTYVHQMQALVEGLSTGAPLPTEGDAILRQQSALDGIYAAAGLRHLRYRD